MTSHVLLLDDDELVLRTHCALFQALGVSCSKALSWREALAALESDVTPQIVVTDLNMPGVDGFTVLQMLREMDGVPELKIYAISGATDAHTQQRVADAGFDGFLSKPLRIDIVRTLIRENSPTVDQGAGWSPCEFGMADAYSYDRALV
jgi:CheY-like chemotaxis protein